MEVGSVGGNEKMSAGTGAHFGFTQIGCVTVQYEHHVTLLAHDDGILVGCGIVQELSKLRHGVLSGFNLGRSNCAERCEHGGVNCPAVVEENTHYFLYEFLFSGGKVS